MTVRGVDRRTAARWAAAVAALGSLWALTAAMAARGMPVGIVLTGVVFGAINALVAVAIVLVYRANRVVNFAAAEFGVVAAVVAIELVVKVHLNYFLALVVGLLLALALGAALEISVIRRLSNAPRLILAVATIGLAQLLDGIAVIIPYEWSHGPATGAFTTPFRVHFRIYPVVFSGDYVTAVVVVPVVLVGLGAFLRYTDYGIAIRAAAENGDRARLVGIPVRRLSTVVWSVTAVLSALAVLLRTPILGFSTVASVSGGGNELLLQTLTAAVVARMTSLPVAVAASIGVGIVEQGGAWMFSNSNYVDALLLVVILVTLLVQRDRFRRAAETGISTWKAITPVRPIPTELARTTVVRAGRWLVPAILATVALAFPYVASPARTNLASVVLLYSIVGVSLVVLTGWTGHISLGQVAFMGLGGAVTGTLASGHHWDVFLALGVAAVATAAVAVVLGLPSLRITGPFLAVATLGFAVVAGDFFNVPRGLSWLVPAEVTRPVLFRRIVLSSDRQMYFVCLVFLVLMLAGAAGLRRAHGGRLMVATKTNRMAVQAFGLDATRINLAAFALSGAIAALAGGLFVIQQEAFNAGSFSPEQGIDFFAMVVIGGLGSLPGAVLGALYVYGAQYLLPPGWSFLASGLGLLLLLMFLPAGLGGLAYRLRDEALRRMARRRGLHVPSLVADSRPPGTAPLLAGGEAQVKEPVA